MTTRTTPLLALLALAACPGGGSTDPSATEATSETTGDPTETTSPTTTVEPDDPGVEPPPAGEGDESCDAGDQAFVKRVVPLLQGRRPEGMREVLLLTSMIQQLGALGKDGRAVVARGLASGDLYVARWKNFLWESLRVNRIEVKANLGCYSASTPAGDDAELAAFIRDNDALGTDFGTGFTMSDVMESALRLDDLSPIYRADMFARMAQPLQGANISQEEFEVNARSNFGEIFEAAYLGRRTGCLECHTSVESVTYSPDPAENHFWAIAGDFEGAIYGDPKGRPEEELFAIFRWTGFVDRKSGPSRPWGMAPACGRFIPERTGDILGVPAYLGGDLPAGQHLYDVDPLFKSGFDALAKDGLAVGDDLSVPPDQALAFLTATTISNGVWRELLGYPLTLAHSFPRNEAQRQILSDLTDAFVSERFSLRSLLTEVVTHPSFNQDAPDRCGTSTPYFLPPVFDPYSVTSGDPNQRGNGVGDRVQRYSAWVLVESAMRAMWWDLPIRQAGYDDPYPGLDFLRDQGVFLKDAISGFNGVDLSGLLSWENHLGGGAQKGLGGDCTGPLGQPCAEYEWIELMLFEGSKTPGVTVRDIAAAIKDRLIAEPTLGGPAEVAAIEALMGMKLDQPMNDVDTLDLEIAARRFAGMLLSTPQFMLSGVPSRDQDPAAVPSFAAPGTDTLSLCQALAPQILGDAFTWKCSAEGVEITG